MFLLGKQAMFGHDPPTYFRSIATTRCPCLAKVHAAIVDPVPPPRITRSYSSGSPFLDDWAEETFSILWFSILFSASFQFLVSPQDPLAVSAESETLATSCCDTLAKSCFSK